MKVWHFTFAHVPGSLPLDAPPLRTQYFSPHGSPVTQKDPLTAKLGTVVNI